MVQFYEKSLAPVFIKNVMYDQLTREMVLEGGRNIS